MAFQKDWLAYFHFSDRWENFELMYDFCQDTLIEAFVIPNLFNVGWSLKYFGHQFIFDWTDLPILSSPIKLSPSTGCPTFLEPLVVFKMVTLNFPIALNGWKNRPVFPCKYPQPSYSCYWVVDLNLHGLNANVPEGDDIMKMCYFQELRQSMEIIGQMRVTCWVSTMIYLIIWIA